MLLHASCSFYDVLWQTAWLLCQLITLAAHGFAAGCGVCSNIHAGGEHKLLKPRCNRSGEKVQAVGTETPRNAQADPELRRENATSAQVRCTLISRVALQGSSQHSTAQPQAIHERGTVTLPLFTLTLAQTLSNDDDCWRQHILNPNA